MKLTPHLPIKYGFNPTKPPTVPGDAQDVGHFSPSFDARLWMFHRRWEPSNSSSPIKATLMIVHGTVDHSGVYQELATALNKIGVAVIAMDMRGWGLSDGESMYFNDTDTFVDDLNTLYTRVHDEPRYRNVKPRFLLGKSLGGLITAYAAARYPSNWTGLLGLSGAYALGPSMTMSPIAVAILTALGVCVPKLPVKPLFDESLIVSNKDALENWRNDELCCKDRLRLGYGIEILRASKELPNHMDGRINIPMLMMIGSNDKVVTKKGHELMIDVNQNPDKELKIYRDGRHNLLQEPSLKDAVTSDILEWMKARL